jgi:predicted DNA-binding protein YlxM (UPF0122 family)
MLDRLAKTPKRIERIEEKFDEVKSMLDAFKTPKEAYDALTPLFKPKQLKFLEVAIERYFNRKTLEEIAKKRGVTREYIRQCENKSIELLRALNSSDNSSDEDFSDIFSGGGGKNLF